MEGVVLPKNVSEQLREMEKKLEVQYNAELDKLK